MPAGPHDDADGGGCVRLQATAVAIAGAAVLFRGPPGAGKSDLALRLIAERPPEGEPPACLLADDQVIITRDGDTLSARAPESIAGLIEIRGVGIRQLPSVSDARVSLIIDLAARESVPRLPPDPLPTEDVLGLPVPVARLSPFEASAPLKARALLGTWGASAV